MKHELAIRIRVHNPLAGVAMKIQRGRNELLEPAKVSIDSLIFDFEISVDLVAKTPNFLGLYAQGPKNARFIYVNSGEYAGQDDTCWARRAKLSLMSVSSAQVEEVLSTPGARLEVSFAGRGGRDGGPTCANVKGLEWRVVKN